MRQKLAQGRDASTKKLWSALSLAVLLCAARAETVEVITDGQQLVDALSAYETRLDSTTLLLASPLISLRNVTVIPSAPQLPDGVAPLGANITIRAADNVSQVVLDAGMRSDLLSALGGHVPIKLSDFIVVNLCGRPLPRSPTYNSTDWWNLHLFFKTRVERSTTFENLVMYAPPAALSLVMYSMIMLRMPFPQVRQAACVLLGDLAPIPYTVQYVRPWGSRSSQATSALDCINITRRVTDNPSDPLLTSLTAQGVIMPAAYCNGTLMTETQERLNEGRLWISMDTSTFVDGLQQAANLSTHMDDYQWKHYPAVYLDGTVHLSQSALPSPIHIGTPLLLRGPYRDDPSIPVQDVLDFEGRVGVLQLAPQAQLFVLGLVLTGLAVQPLPMSTMVSALPIAAISMTSGPTVTSPVNASNDVAAAPYVYLNNCTLVLPVADYTALRALALAGRPGASAACAATAAGVHAQALRAGISELALEDHGDPQAAGTFLLATFTGWGVQGYGVRVAIDPATVTTNGNSSTADLPDDGCALAYAEPGAPQSDATRVRTIVIAVVVSVVGGCALLAAGVGLWMWFSCRTAAQRAPRGEDSKASLGCKGCSPHSSCRDEELGSRGNAGESSSSHVVSEPSQSQDVGARDVQPLLFGAGGEAPESALGQHVLSSHQRLVDEAAPLPGCTSGEDPHDVARADVAGLCADGAMDVAHSHSLTDSRAVDGSASVYVSAMGSAGPGTAARPPGSCGQYLDADSNAWGPVMPPPAVCDGCCDNSPAPLGDPCAKGAPAAGSRAVVAAAHPQADAEEYTRRIQQLAGSLRADVDKLVLRRVLSVGGFGVVMLGLWRNLPVAVKTLTFQMDERQLAEVTATLPAGGQQHGGKPRGRPAVPAILETAIAASVGHPNLVATYHYDIVRAQEGAADIEAGGASNRRGLQVLDVSSADGGAIHTYKLYLVQELCACSLVDVFPRMVDANTGTVPPALVYPLMRDVVRGLAYLHARGIVHGDLKPGNILLAPIPNVHPPASMAKLTDYGLSVLLGEGATHVSNFAAGSPFYVAPEVVKQRRVSPASDVFAAGVVMWEFLAGARCYSVSISEARSEDGRPPQRPQVAWHPAFPGFPAHVVAALSIEAIRLCYWCMQSEPQDRPSANKVCEALEAMMAGLPGSTPPSAGRPPTPL